MDDGCGLHRAFCLPVVTMRRGEPSDEALPQVLLVDDNPADVGLAREALAGGRHQSAISNVRTARRLWPICVAPARTRTRFAPTW